MRTRFTLGIISGVAFTLCGLSPVIALPLSPGGTLYPAPAELDPLPGGTVVADSGLVPFSAATFTGNLRSVVITGDPTNPAGLTFIYSVTNNSASQHDIGRLTVLDFAGWLTDASYQPGTGHAPALVNRSTPDVIGFNFLGFPLGAGTLAPGMTSAWLVVQTNAPAWKQTTASVIDGSVAMVLSYGPVPEPATLGLLGVALGCLASRRAKRS